jgi:two-component system sensor histidine kinase KdpD
MTAKKQGPGRQWVVWFAALTAATALLSAFRNQLDKAHVALLFLLLVLGGSAAGGRLLGLTLAGAAFVVFDLGFLPPYFALRVTDPRDWIVLVAFLVTGVVAAELLERRRREAEIARARTSEIDRLSTLGAETLNAPRPEDALRAISEVIRQSTGVEHCVIDLSRAAPADSKLQDGGDTQLPTRERNIPLRVREAVVGTLTLSSARPFLLSRDQERVLGALSYYAALGVERLRLAGAEDEAVALRRADRLKDALLASISHDLRTPLTTIKGIANEIARGGDAERASVIEEEADRLSTIVNDLLDLSLLAAGQMMVRAEINTADDVVGAVLQRVEAAFPDREIRVALEGPWVELVGRFDLVHTVRILTNLLENAARYAPTHSSITLSAWRDSDSLCFAVEDQGDGILATDLERVFEPFQRGTKSSVRGTGLGLSIARRLAEMQGGHLEYQPRPPVKSRFVLSLPAADVPLA